MATHRSSDGELPMAGLRATLSELGSRTDIGDNEDLRVLALGASGHRCGGPTDVIDPFELLKDGPRPGDVLVRHAPAEGIAYLGVIVGDYVALPETFAARGLTVEAAGPGLYVEVAEVPFEGGAVEFSARRVTDARGRSPRGQTIRRPQPARAAPIDDDDDDWQFESEELARHAAYAAPAAWPDQALTEAEESGGRPTILASARLRQAWSAYECADEQMTSVRLFGRSTPVNPETVDAWRVFERVLLAAGYQPHRAWVYNCRHIAGQQTRSLHAYGLAIDIDHDEPVCNVNRPTPSGRAVRFSTADTKEERCHDVRRGVADTSFTAEQIAAVEAINTVDGHQVFTWGGRWRLTKDTMHFQINVTPTELARGIRTDASPTDGAVIDHSNATQAGFETLAEDVDDYSIGGGKYAPEEKKKASTHRAGLILTSSITGRLEERLIARAPYPLSVSKEWTRFGSGRLGTFVANYNEFTYYFGEVLAAIGRLQDLLSAGAPEIPDFMTSRQKHALRPTTDTATHQSVKSAYQDWLKERTEYANAEHGVLSGLVFQVNQTARAVERQRHAFWRATDELKQAISDAKRLAKNKPQYDALDLKLSDLVSVGAAVAEGGPLALVTVVAATVDVVAGARKKRKEYDTKMIEFIDLARAVEPRLKDMSEKLRDSQEAYWDLLLAHAETVQKRNSTRVSAREMAALVGQGAAPNERRNEVLAELRMPGLVADAWRALSIVGPPARAKLRDALNGREIVEKASLQDLSWRGQQNPFADITQIRRAWREAHYVWEPVLTREAVEDWQSVNKLWDEVFNRFNV